MAKGENIFKRKDGRWEARYIKGYHLSGKIQYGYCYGKTYREAKEKVLKCRYDLLNGVDVSNRKKQHTFNEYCDQWLSANKKRVKDSTYIKYEHILNQYIKKELGECNPLNLTNTMIEQFSQILLEKKQLSVKTVKDILVVLRSVLNYTAKQVQGQFPVIDIVYPKEQRKEMQILSYDEQQRFIVYLFDDMDSTKFGIYLSLCTGLRIGEICALKWSDVLMHHKLIRITSTMQRLKNMNHNESKTCVITGPPKSDKSYRLIPISESLFQLCQKMKPEKNEAYVLTGTSWCMEPRTLQYRLQKAAKECKITHLHFHMLRHTFATRCIEAGFDIKSLSEILGHANTSITLNRYVHSSLELKRNQMEKLHLSQPSNSGVQSELEELKS